MGLTGQGRKNYLRAVNAKKKQEGTSMRFSSHWGLKETLSLQWKSSDKKCYDSISESGFWDIRVGYKTTLTDIMQVVIFVFSKQTS